MVINYRNKAYVRCYLCMHMQGRPNNNNNPSLLPENINLAPLHVTLRVRPVQRHKTEYVQLQPYRTHRLFLQEIYNKSTRLIEARIQSYWTIVRLLSVLRWFDNLYSPSVWRAKSLRVRLSISVSFFIFTPLRVGCSLTLKANRMISSRHHA